MMDYLPLLVTAFFLCNIVRSIWKSWTAPKITSYRIFDAVITWLVVAFLGGVLGWNSSLSIWWWYALVALTALYAGTVALRLQIPASRTSTFTSNRKTNTASLAEMFAQAVDVLPSLQPLERGNEGTCRGCHLPQGFSVEIVSAKRLERIEGHFSRLVAMTALYAGKAAFHRKSPKSPTSEKSPKSPKSPILR